MTFRSKVLLAQAPLGLALLLVALLAVRTIGALGIGAESILKENYRSVLAAQRMGTAIEALDRAALFELAGRGDLHAPGVDAHIERFEAELQVEEGNITEVGEREAAALLRQHWEDYRTRFAQFRQLPPASAASVYFEQLAPAFTRVRGTAERVLEVNQDAMLHKSDRAREHAQRMGTLMLGASVTALVLGIVLSSILTGRLTQPVSRLRAAADRIGAGEFDARVEVVGADELAQLGTTFNSMADRLQRYRRSSLGELLLAQQAAQSAIDSLPDPVLVFDANRDVLIVNRAGDALLGSAAVGGLPAEPALRGTIERARGHVLAGKGPFAPRGFEDAVRVASSSDGEQYYLARATPVYGEEGGITGATVILQDVTRLHRFDQLKNDLVATVAHEFRTPLTSLHMAIHLCLEQAAGPLSEKQADLLYAARQDCDRLQRIVDELLDLAKIRGGRMQLQRRRVAPRALLDAAIDAQQSGAAERHVSLAIQLAPGLPEIEVDPERLQLVFANLIGNAIRHAPENTEVRVTAGAVGGAVRFEVVDQGPGIPPARREVIFERFTQGGEASGAAGLGLAIAKEIVTAHGGAIGVESTLGAGSTFWFTLPGKEEA